MDWSWLHVNEFRMAVLGACRYFVLLRGPESPIPSGQAEFRMMGSGDAVVGVWMAVC